MAIYTDGFSTIITLGGDPVLTLVEVAITPPDEDTGGPIDVTNMRQIQWRTAVPKKLVSMNPFTFTAAYDPKAYGRFVSVMKKNQNITVTFPDGNTMQFLGYYDKFKPNQNKEGERPTAEVTVVPTNLANAGVEVGPSWSAGV